MNYWLLKSEPTTFSLRNLQDCPEQTEMWDGVRNYQARNFLKQMQVGDLALFYHSRCQPPAAVGIVEIVKAAYPDPTQFDPQAYHFDAKATPENPRWVAVDIKFQRVLPRPVSLAEMKSHPQLEDMLLTKKGNRLSVLPVSPEHWDFICQLSETA